MEVVDLSLPGLKLIKPRVFGDARGFLLESYSRPRYAEHGIDIEFVQDNHSRSSKGTLRGLHYQSSPGQAKLVRVAAGSIVDVVVDIRPTSPTFGRWERVQLDADSHWQVFIPVGFAHGFCVLSESADVLYKVSSVYSAQAERGIAWNDPELAIDWPTDAPLLSERDRNQESFAACRERLGAPGAG